MASVEITQGKGTSTLKMRGTLKKSGDLKAGREAGYLPAFWLLIPSPTLIE